MSVPEQEIGPAVSVVVPFQNARAHIRTCLDGLLALDPPGRGFEIVMVDNNCTDGSDDIVREFETVRLVSETRPGPYAARNRGISEARGEIIAFTDADCHPHHGWLKAMCDEMNDPGTSIVQGPQVFAGRSPVLSFLAAYESEKNAFIFSEGASEAVYACANSLAVRRSLFEEVGSFDERIRGADVIFVHRAIGTRSRDVFKYAPGASVVHLEIGSTAAWLSKLFVYGRSYEAYRRVVDCRPLSARERMRIVGRLLRQRPRAFPVLFVLGPALALGALSYETGRWSGRLAKTDRNPHKP